MRKIVKVAIAAIVGAVLVAQQAEASLAMAIIGSDYVLLASDSRAWDVERDRPAGDTHRKIDAREGYAIMVTNYPVPGDIWRQVPIRPGESAEHLARRICAAVPRPSRVDYLAHGQIRSRIVVVRLGPPIDVVVLDVEFRPDGQFSVIQIAHPPAMGALAIGFEWPNSDTEIRRRGETRLCQSGRLPWHLLGRHRAGRNLHVFVARPARQMCGGLGAKDLRLHIPVMAR